MTSAYLQEVKEVAILALPVVISYVFHMIMGVVAIIFSGSLGTKEQDGTALGVVWVNVTGMSVFAGLVGALDTLASQAYGKQENHKKVGLYLQRTWFVCGIVSVPVVILWVFSGDILNLLGMDETVTPLAELYTRISIPSLYGYILSCSLRSYLEAQSVIIPTCVCSAIGCGLTALFTWLGINYLGWGFYSIPLGQVIGEISFPFTLVIYIFYSKLYAETWDGWTREAMSWSGFVQYIKLGGSSTLMGCAEWWAMEIQTVLAGRISTTVLAAQSALFVTLNLMFMVTLGFSIAASTRVGNELGRGRAKAAQYAAKTAVSMLLPIQVVFSLIFMLLTIFGSYWSVLFSHDPEVILIINTAMPLLSSTIITDAGQGVIGGVIRGSGQQNVGALVNLVAFYAIGIPLSLFLAFYIKWNGILSIWTGITSGSFFQCCCYFVLLMRTDWHQKAKEALERVEEEERDINTDYDTTTDGFMSDAKL